MSNNCDELIEAMKEAICKEREGYERDLEAGEPPVTQDSIDWGHASAAYDVIEQYLPNHLRCSLPPTDQPDECRVCGGKGWFSDADYHTGEEVQVQCEACYGTGKPPKRAAIIVSSEDLNKSILAVQEAGIEFKVRGSYVE